MIDDVTLRLIAGALSGAAVGFSVAGDKLLEWVESVDDKQKTVRQHGKSEIEYPSLGCKG